MFYGAASLELEDLIERQQNPRNFDVVFPNKEARRYSKVKDFESYIHATGGGATDVEAKIRRTIASRYYRTDLERITQSDTDQRSLPNRISINERNYRDDASVVIAEEIRNDDGRQRLLGELAQALEDPKLHRKNDREKYCNYASLFRSAIETGREDTEAAKYLHTLAKLWIVNTAKEHEVWEQTLDRYNRQFRDKEIDPNDPTYLFG